MKIKFFFIICVVLMINFTFTSCKTKQNNLTIKDVDKLEDNVISATAPVIVYKTIRDFSDYVPVIMNREKTAIVSYPDRTDISTNQKPSALNKGYLLDNRGINENVVYIKLTYEAYRNLNKNPDLDELNSLILEKYPLLELYYCNNRNNYQNLIPELNNLIDNGFSGCEKADIVPLMVKIKQE